MVDVRVYKIKAVANLLKGNVKQSISFFEQIPNLESQESNLILHYVWALTLNKEYTKAKDLIGKVNLDSKSRLFDLKRKVASELDKIVIKPTTGDKDA